MKRRAISLVLLFACFSVAARTVCAQQFLGWDYDEQARTKNIDIKHIALNISFDAPQKKVIGKVMTTLVGLPGPEPFRQFTFDASDMQIRRIWIEGEKKNLSFDTTQPNKLLVMLGRDVPFNKPITVGIEYDAFPKKGLYFVGPDTFYTKRPEQIWTQGEGEDNHHWFPTYDYPNDKTTTEMYVTVRANQQALSNGKLESKKKNADGSVTWHYVMTNPHSTYLVMLGIGDYKVVEEKWRGKPVQYWVYPGWENDAKRIFGLTPKMLEFFSNKIGVEYAWDKYAQIPVADFMYGGMENTTATVMNDYILYDKRAGVDFNAQGLIAHELAHQWFGDLLTCRSWIHMWLNESFATYFEALFNEYHQGRDEFDEEMYGSQQAGPNAEATLGKKPIVAANNYTANHYPRGASTLHMLRFVLGDTAFFASINHYVQSHKFQNVTTEDLKIAIEEATGQNLQWFFDEWVYKSGHPVLDVTSTYDDAAKLVRLRVAQTQKQDSLTGLFRMPVDVELAFADGTTRVERIKLQDSVQTFTLVSPQRPVNVIFDKGNYLIKEIAHHKSADEWVYQLQHGKLAIERSLAAQQLASAEYKGNTAVMGALRQAAINDPFWSTRSYAVGSFAKVADSTAVGSLVTEVMSKEVKPEVRGTAFNFLNSVSDASTKRRLIDQALADSSDHLTRAGLRSLAAIDKGAAYMRAMALLNTESARDRNRQNALDVISETKNKQTLATLIQMVGTRDLPKWTRYGIIDQISKQVSVDSERVYQVLWSLANNGDKAISGTALNRLADIGNEQTLAELERSASTHPDQKSTYDALLERMRKRLAKQKAN